MLSAKLDSFHLLSLSGKLVAVAFSTHYPSLCACFSPCNQKRSIENMQKFTASPWTTWLSSWQCLSGINNLGWQLPWLSEGGGMLVQWYINTWVYKLFKSQFLIRPDISVTQLHTLSPTEPPFLSCMFLHMCRGCVAHPLSWGMSHLCWLAARLQMKPATFF